MSRFIPLAFLSLMVAVGCDNTRPAGERTYFNGDGSVTRVEGRYDPAERSVVYQTERYGSRGAYNQAKPQIDAAKDREVIGKLIKDLLWRAVKCGS